jgi:hypothetical protein
LQQFLQVPNFALIQASQHFQPWQRSIKAKARPEPRNDIMKRDWACRRERLYSSTSSNLVSQKIAMLADGLGASYLPLPHPTLLRLRHTVNGGCLEKGSSPEISLPSGYLCDWTRVGS